MSKDIILKVIQMNSSDFRQFFRILGFNDLCKLQKYQDFINYVNYDKMYKSLAAFLDLPINQFFYY